LRFRNGLGTVGEVNLGRKSVLRARYKRKQRPGEEAPGKGEGDRGNHQKTWEDFA